MSVKLQKSLSCVCLSVSLPPFRSKSPYKGAWLYNGEHMAWLWGGGFMNSYSRTGSLEFIYLFIQFAAAVKKQ